MNIFKCSCADKWGETAPLILRIATGLIFFLHGWMKLANVSGVAGMLTGLSVPVAGLFAWIITLLEVGGGIALIFGVATHWISKLLAFEMLVAVLLMYASKGNFDQTAFLLFASSFSLMVSGAGKWGCDGMCRK